MLDPAEGWSGPASSAGRNADRARCGAGSWRICSLSKVNFYAGWVPPSGEPLRRESSPDVQPLQSNPA